MKHTFLLLFILALTSCSSKLEEKKSIVINKEDYSINYPSEWVSKEDKHGAEILLCSEIAGEEDNFADNFNIIKQDLTGKNIDLRIFDSISKFQIIDNLGDKAILESQTLSDHSSFLFKGQFEGRNLKWKQVYFLKRETAYILTYTAEEKSFDKYSDIAEAIFKSFKLK